MPIIPAFLHRKSLSVALATLPVSFVLSCVFALGEAFRPITEPMCIRLIIGVAIALILCGLAWLNLIRDVERGYSPWRCSLAAVVLLAATVWPVLVLTTAAGHLLFIFR